MAANKLYRSTSMKVCFKIVKLQNKEDSTEAWTAAIKQNFYQKDNKRIKNGEDSTKA